MSTRGITARRMRSAQTCQVHLTARATLGSKVTRTQTAQVNSTEGVNLQTFVCLFVLRQNE